MIVKIHVFCVEIGANQFILSKSLLEFYVPYVQHLHYTHKVIVIIPYAYCKFTIKQQQQEERKKKPYRKFKGQSMNGG